MGASLASLWGGEEMTSTGEGGDGEIWVRAEGRSVAEG